MRYIFLLVCISLCPIHASAEKSDSDPKTQAKEDMYKELRSLYESGSFNRLLFLELAKHTPRIEEKIAYLRQSMLFDPNNISIRDQLFELKQSLRSDTSPQKLHQKESWIDILSLKSYVPFYVIDYILIISSILIPMTIVFKITPRFLNVCIIFISSYVLLDKLIITYTRDGSLRVINSLVDITKTEGICLQDIKTYASKDANSQITGIIKAGSEVDILNSAPRLHEWIKIKFDNGRSGWYKYQTDELFVIKR